jgi:hypothetical protein
LCVTPNFMGFFRTRFLSYHAFVCLFVFVVVEW